MFQWVKVILGDPTSDGNCKVKRYNLKPPPFLTPTVSSVSPRLPSISIKLFYSLSKIKLLITQHLKDNGALQQTTPIPIASTSLCDIYTQLYGHVHRRCPISHTLGATWDVCTQLCVYTTNIGLLIDKISINCGALNTGKKQTDQNFSFLELFYLAGW